MINDLGKMTDKDYGEKWGINRVVVTRDRVKMGIPSFLPQLRAKRKNVDNTEYKWCPRGGGHWEKLNKFKLSPTRLGGYRGVCNEHEKEDRRNSYRKNNGKGKAAEWRKTSSGKKSLRKTWRKQKAIKDNAYVFWDSDCEARAYLMFHERCGYCGEPTPFLSIEFDHFIPISLGGKTEPKNMVPCCKVCNHGIGGKFDKNPEHWIHERFAPVYAKYIYENCVEKLNELNEIYLGNL